MDNVVEEKSFRFAVRIVNLNKHLRSVRNEYVLSKQFLRSGTSIGANITESLYGSSRKDCNIALWSASLAFPHPKSGERMCFSANPPEVYPWTEF